MKKRILLPLLGVLMAALLAGCFCSHDSWAEAGCDTPRTCENCGKTEGEPAGHDWQEACCGNPMTCARCGLTEGEPGDHSWQEAACETPKLCTICRATQGKPAGHHWTPATTEQPQTCTVCGKETGERIVTDPRFTTAANEPIFGIWEGELVVPVTELGIGLTMEGMTVRMAYRVIFNNDGTMLMTRVPVEEEEILRAMAAQEAEQVYRLFEWDGYSRGEADAAIRKTYDMTMEEYVRMQMGDVDVTALFPGQAEQYVYYLEGQILHHAADWSRQMRRSACTLDRNILNLSLDGAEAAPFTRVEE